MALMLEDMIVLFVQGGLKPGGRHIPGVVLSASLFMTSSAAIPAGIGPYISLTKTGGSGREGTHNAAAEGKAGYVRPNMQILVRHKEALEADKKAKQIYDFITSIGQKSQYINGTWYRSITPLQEPYDFGQDQPGRAQVVFNVAIVKRP